MKLILRRPSRRPHRSDRSSITDREEYRRFCEQAAHDDAVFATFRRAPIYVDTLEHVSPGQGAAYIAAIRRDNPDILASRPERYLTNDRLGNPQRVHYPETGLVSPVTLRYLKVVSDVMRLFGDLTGARVIEIGVGYGGQCRLLCEYWNLASYTLVDLAPALGLAKRYLSTLSVGTELRFVTPEDAWTIDSDLCISNYAFSELNREVQEGYVAAFLAHADRGYLTCNFISHLHGLASMTRGELASVHAGTRWLAEEPQTYPGNGILIWGKRQDTAEC